MLEEIEAFSRELYAELESNLGAEEAGVITLEVSSPVLCKSILFHQRLHAAVQPTAFLFGYELFIE